MGMEENIEQHKRRRHTELDNIFQVRSWMESMSRLTKSKLDSNKCIDIVKYATILGSPTCFNRVEPWMRKLLDGKPPTFENKLEAISTAGITHKFLTDMKATIQHPEMNNYKKLLPRVRIVRGFAELDALQSQIQDEVGTARDARFQSAMSSRGVQPDSAWSVRLGVLPDSLRPAPPSGKSH
jgi:hypothetical protein